MTLCIRRRKGTIGSSSVIESAQLPGLATQAARSLCLYAVLAGLVLWLGLTAPVRAAGLDDAKRGLAELVRGNFQQAVVYTTKAIDSGQLESESLAITHFNRAEGYQRLGRPALATDDFKQAYRAWPEHPVTRAKMRELGLMDRPLEADHGPAD